VESEIPHVKLIGFEIVIYLFITPHFYSRRVIDLVSKTGNWCILMLIMDK